MLLTIDVGNTNIVFGIFSGDELIAQWRLTTDRQRTGDEYGVFLNSLCTSRGIAAGGIGGCIMASVVPQVESAMKHLCVRYYNKEPLIVGPDLNLGMKICYDNPAELGADRIVNAVAAFEKYRRSLIVIDCGTATTFDYVSPEGDYRGGAIAPGITIGRDALFQRASKLPTVGLDYPKTVVGQNTVASMQTGIVVGYVSLVDGIVERIKGEVKTDPFVVATGGLGRLIAHHAKTIQDIDEDLTLKGLKIIYERNRGTV